MQGPARIARIAAEEGVGRVVHISAIGASETSPARYHQTKAQGEAAVKSAFPSATIMRPSLVFGPEDDFFNKFAWIARLSPVLPLIGGGKTRFQPVFVGDVAKAIAKAVTDPACAGKTYDLPGGETLSYRAMVGRIFDGLGMRRIIVPVPDVAWRLALPLAVRVMPGLSATMAQRMAKNMTFDSAPAAVDFNYAPRPFRPQFPR